MFDQTQPDSARSRAAIPLACALEVILVGGLVLVPLIRTQALGITELQKHWDLVPLAPSAPRGSRPIGQQPKKPNRTTAPTHLQIPTAIPDTISRGEEQPTTPDSTEVNLPIGLPWGESSANQDPTIATIISGLATPARPAPPTSTRRAKGPLRVRPGGQIQPAELIYRPDPVYPHLAVITRTEGTVYLEAIISTDGSIHDLRFISGPPFLVQAAMEAVSKWRYQPTLLNGEPVEVMMEVEVKFKLAE